MINNTSHLIFLNFDHDGQLVHEELTIQNFYTNFETIMSEGNNASQTYIRTPDAYKIFNQDVNYTTAGKGSALQRIIVMLNMDACNANTLLRNRQYNLLKMRFINIQLQWSTEEIPEWKTIANGFIQPSAITASPCEVNEPETSDHHAIDIDEEYSDSEETSSSNQSSENLFTAMTLAM